MERPHGSSGVSKNLVELIFRQSLKEYYYKFYIEYKRLIKTLIEQGKEVGIFLCKILSTATEVYIDMYNDINYSEFKTPETV